MDAELFENNPFRQPQWRLERVMQMLEHRPKPLRPRRSDDYYVRAYRNFLMSYLSAGNDEKLLQAAIAGRPHFYHAHKLYFARGSQLRRIAEAWLLTTASYTEIAKRLATDEGAIDVFEKLFFNVRDRLHARDWIAKVILGPPTDRTATDNGVLTDDQKGFLYRWFGHCGGPLVLDVLIAGMAPGAIPQSAQEIGPWFDDTLAQIVRSRAAEVAGLFAINRSNVMHVLKLALRENRKRATSKASPGPPQEVTDNHAAKALKMLDQWQAIRATDDAPELDAKISSSI